MKLSDQECPECGQFAEHNDDLQEVGDYLYATYHCGNCDTDFEVTFEESDKAII